MKPARATIPAASRIADILKRTDGDQQPALVTFDGVIIGATMPAGEMYAAMKIQPTRTGEPVMRRLSTSVYVERQPAADEVVNAWKRKPWRTVDINATNRSDA